MWTTTPLAGKSCDVFEPAGSPAGVVLFLHGYDNVTLKENVAYTAALERHQLACVCPHGPGCWWTETVFPPFDPAVSPIAWLRGPLRDAIVAKWPEAGPWIAVTGIEMGGQGALQLAYRAARQFPVVAAISPKVDFESWHGHGTTLDELFPDREAARQQTATLHLHPLNWPRQQLLLCDPADHYCIDGVLILASKLFSTGIPFEQDFTTSHGGYGWNYANAMADRVIDFLVAGLQAERARLKSREEG